MLLLREIDWRYVAIGSERCPAPASCQLHTIIGPLCIVYETLPDFWREYSYVRRNLGADTSTLCMPQAFLLQPRLLARCDLLRLPDFRD